MSDAIPISVAVWAEALVGPYTGTRTVLENLINYTDRSGLQITYTLACPSWVNPHSLRARFPTDAVRVVSVQGRRWKNRLLWLAGGASISRDIGRHDIYISGWHWPLGGRDRPFLGILHDLRMLDPAWNDPTVSVFRRILWRTLLDLSVRVCLSRASAVVVPSQYTLDHLVRLGYKFRLVPSVIPHGVDREFWSFRAGDSELESTLERIGADPKRDFILSIGQHTPHKNFRRLIAGFSETLGRSESHAQLIIVGGENVQTLELRGLIDGYRMKESVVLAGTVSRNDLRVLMGRARVFAFPSLFEGFGLPVLEAFAAGVPVVTSNSTSLAEIAQGAALLVDAEDSSEIGRALVLAWQDETVRKDLLECASKRARMYTWERAVGHYLQVFAAIAERRDTR